MREFKKQQGFLTIAQNNSDVNYLELARLQAESVKDTQKIRDFAVIVDGETNKLITEKHRQYFDYVIVLKEDDAAKHEWKLHNEWQVFGLTPFKETLKLESDLLMTRSIDHWWNAFRLKPVCFSYHCRNYLQEVVVDTKYRKIFVDNNLPDIYNGLYYFRFTREAAEFFNMAKNLFRNWDTVSKALVRATDTEPTTDVVFALAAKLLGQEQFYIPTMDYINFVHMKSGIQGWSDNQPWTDYAMLEKNGSRIRINNIEQLWPVHYHEKGIQWNE